MQVLHTYILNQTTRSRTHPEECALVPDTASYGIYDPTATAVIGTQSAKSLGSVCLLAFEIRDSHKPLFTLIHRSLQRRGAGCRASHREAGNRELQAQEGAFERADWTRIGDGPLLAALPLQSRARHESRDTMVPKVSHRSRAQARHGASCGQVCTYHSGLLEHGGYEQVVLPLNGM